MYLRGRIIEEQKNHYFVDTEKGIIKSALKGVLKKQKNRLYVGDFVDIELFNIDQPEGIIRKLYQRENKFHKPAIANIQQIVFLNTLKEPALNLEFIDRFLLSSEVLHFPTLLVFNKNDLYTPTDKKKLSEITSYYSKIGYTCITVSALTGENLDSLIKLCNNMLSILAGLSGTGKSTILAKIFPEKSFRTQELSKNVSRGKHTTTSTILLKLPNFGYIADTPGFSFIDLPEIDEKDVSSHFPEISSNQGNCRFNNCIHEYEPGCAIKPLVETGEIAPFRYKNYLTIYNAIKEKRRKYNTPKKKLKS
jgi:ribosome biogenesis GTPase